MRRSTCARAGARGEAAARAAEGATRGMRDGRGGHVNGACVSDGERTACGRLRARAGLRERSRWHSKRGSAAFARHPRERTPSKLLGRGVVTHGCARARLGGDAAHRAVLRNLASRRLVSRRLVRASARVRWLRPRQHARRPRRRCRTVARRGCPASPALRPRHVHPPRRFRLRVLPEPRGRSSRRRRQRRQHRLPQRLRPRCLRRHRRGDRHPRRGTPRGRRLPRSERPLLRHRHRRRLVVSHQDEANDPRSELGRRDRASVRAPRPQGAGAHRARVGRGSGQTRRPPRRRSRPPRGRRRARRLHAAQRAQNINRADSGDDPGHPRG